MGDFLHWYFNSFMGGYLTCVLSLACTATVFSYFDKKESRIDFFKKGDIVRPVLKTHMARNLICRVNYVFPKQTKQLVSVDVPIDGPHGDETKYIQFEASELEKVK